MDAGCFQSLGFSRSENSTPKNDRMAGMDAGWFQFLGFCGAKPHAQK
jgi:hypothetical protein